LLFRVIVRRRHRGAQASGAEALAAFGAAAGENKAALLRCHARAKTVAACADQFARLKCAFHSENPCFRFNIVSCRGGYLAALMRPVNICLSIWQKTFTKIRKKSCFWALPLEAFALSGMILGTVLNEMNAAEIK
jgi:hypothetical protein